MVLASPLLVDFALTSIAAICGWLAARLVLVRAFEMRVVAATEAVRREREEERRREERLHGEAGAATADVHRQLLAELRRAGAEATSALEQQLLEAKTERAAAHAARSLAESQLAVTSARLAAALAQAREQRDQFEADRAAIEAHLREAVQSATTSALLEANRALLEQSSRQFSEQRAETMRSVETATRPLSDGIVRLHQSVLDFDKARSAGAASLKATLETMARSDDALRQTVERSTTETAKLATALRDNRVRGRWGEIGLRNVLDKVGLTDFCDFVEQTGNADGKRPDVVIKLPGDHEVAVDSKVPFEAYMCALEATDPAEQQRLLIENAQALRHKVRELAARGYHRTPKAIGVTILYVQIESVVAAALGVDPALVEDALDLGIVISTPATLLAYLRAFSREWSLHKQSANAERIVEQAHEMLGRLVTFAERFATIGVRLGDSVKAWNAAVASFDGRLAVTARTIGELSGTAFQIAKPAQQLEIVPRDVAKVAELEAAAAILSPSRAAGHHQSLDSEVA